MVFGLWRIEERRILARASYAFVFSQTRRRPWRASIYAELRARVGRDRVFRKESVTGAIGAALKKLGLAWPRLEVPDGGAARDAPGGTAVDSDDEDFVRLMIPGDNNARPAPLGPHCKGRDSSHRKNAPGSRVSRFY